eukprot:TRINITY_DN10567_c0_g1_i1.p1 TRINITY_DN10567_c0_g1~~TRINITY_DN10567_c0_g1_i1.p1  ORF type:complete len:550 (-),score=63.77 TRINITY_DN10567_c0_g1_i1:101-1750(-)
MAGPRDEPADGRTQHRAPRGKPLGDSWQAGGERLFNELYRPNVNDERWDKGSTRRPNEGAAGKKRADWLVENERLRNSTEMRTVVYDNITQGNKSRGVSNKFAKARVEDMTTQIDAEASRLRALYKRPRFSWKEVMRDDLRTSRMSGDLPAIGDGVVWLSKFLSHSGACSRRNVTELVLQGRVSVNGEIVQEPALKINPQTDEVALDGKVRKLRTLDEIIWIMINKPKNTITTREDGRGRKCIVDLVPFAKTRRLVYLGRLDRNATGLMLLTNDYEWQSVLTHPRHEIPKRYKVVVWEGEPSEDKIRALEQGIMLPDSRKPLLPLTDFKVLGNEKDEGPGSCSLSFRTTEGGYHFIQRMFEWIGHPVMSIKRTEFGQLKMDKTLKHGEWRMLTPKEIRQLKGSTILKRPRPPPEEKESELLDAVSGGKDEKSDRRGAFKKKGSQELEGDRGRPSRKGSVQEWEQDRGRTLRSDRSQRHDEDDSQPWMRGESNQRDEDWDEDDNRTPRRSRKQDSGGRPTEKPKEDWEAGWIKQLDQMQTENAPAPSGVR